MKFYVKLVNCFVFVREMFFFTMLLVFEFDVFQKLFLLLCKIVVFFFRFIQNLVSIAWFACASIKFRNEKTRVFVQKSPFFEGKNRFKKFFFLHQPKKWREKRINNVFGIAKLVSLHRSIVNHVQVCARSYPLTDEFMLVANCFRWLQKLIDNYFVLFRSLSSEYILWQGSLLPLSPSSLFKRQIALCIPIYPEQMIFFYKRIENIYSTSVHSCCLFLCVCVIIYKIQTNTM